jgi:hypothetical protein
MVFFLEFRVQVLIRRLAAAALMGGLTLESDSSIHADLDNGPAGARMIWLGGTRSLVERISSLSLSFSLYLSPSLFLSLFLSFS